MDLPSNIIFVSALIACSYAANETGLTTLTDYDCGCPGQNASYICTAIDGVITVWGGTAFSDCTGTVLNEILLRHSDFQNAIGECNNGAIRGYSIKNVGNFFTSRLDVRLSADLQGRTISCSLDDGNSVTLIDTETLIVTTPSVPPPSPERISTMVVNDNPQELIFSWDQDYNCPTLQYNFTSHDCGSCATNTSQAVSCTEFQASFAGITCTLTVWSVVCGNITGPQSMRSTNVNLKVPDAPTIDTLPHYQDGQIQLLIELITTFPTVAPTFISDGIDGSIHYTITYSDSTFGSSCGTATILASSCVDGICTHTFDILQSSSCPPSTTIIVSVVASNVLGSGPQSTPIIREGINNLVNVNFNLNRRRITCTFLNQPPNIMKQCSANITYGKDCDRFLGVFSGMGIEDTVATQPLETVPGVAEYCFLVTAETNNVTVLINGFLTIESQANVIAAIVIPLVFISILLVVLVAVIVVAVKCLNVPESTVHVAFSVEDKPGSLAAALKVFKDCNINILALNTHLHHAEFDRNAGNGYKFNYVHCICHTKDDKEFLKNELMAEFEGGDQEHVTEHITAIIKVKADRPGTLWKAIHKIGERKINIVGVNTLSDRESIPGYKYNSYYVKCRCSQKSLHKVKTQLKQLTGKEVKTKFSDEEYDKQERTIQYLVRDKPGALASTLQVISTMGINISGVNLDHLPAHFDRTTKSGRKMNFIECSRSADEQTFFDILKREYGAAKVESYKDIPPRDPNNCIIKVTVHNEAGALNKVLKAFHVLDRSRSINISGVNVLEPAFEREREIPYKHYHLEITATNEQYKKLKKDLLAHGLAVDIGPFHRPKHQQADQANDIQNLQQTHHDEQEERDSTAEKDISPTTKVIQFLVRDEVGALAKALQLFSALGVNITKINPSHLFREHQDEFVECSCAETQRKSLIDKLISRGATKAEALPEEEVQQGRIFHPDHDANYCVMKFSVGSEAKSIADVLKVFDEMGVKILKVNPRHIKVYNQYVECCCTKEDTTKVLKNLEEIDGVTHVTLEPESKVPVKPTTDPNYCIIKYSVGEKAGTIVRALAVFFELNINIIGVNTLNPIFDRNVTFKYKHNHVVLVANDDQEEELSHQLLVTGLAIDVKPYTRIKHDENMDQESLQSGIDMTRNATALTTVETNI